MYNVGRFSLNFSSLIRSDNLWNSSTLRATVRAMALRRTVANIQRYDVDRKSERSAAAASLARNRSFEARKLLEGAKDTDESFL